MTKRKQDITDKIASLMDKHIEPVIEKHIHEAKNDKEHFVRKLHVYTNINLMSMYKIRAALPLTKNFKHFMKENIKHVLEKSKKL
jgi:hypothetical protein